MPDRLLHLDPTLQARAIHLVAAVDSAVREWLHARSHERADVVSVPDAAPTADLRPPLA